jgi:hypothetical protein
MFQNLTTVPTFDGTNYGYLKARLGFFFTSIDCSKSIETGWTKLEDANLKLFSEKKKFQCVKPLKKNGKILETTYEGRKLVKSVKFQMLISRFKEIKMLEDETFGEFYTKMNDLRNSMVSLGKTVMDVKLIRKILRSLPEHFRMKVTTIEERKDL